MPELCTPWITGDDLTAAYADDQGCETDSLAGIPLQVLDDAAYLASSILFYLTGEKLTGACAAEVRPCARRPWYPGPAWGPGVTRPVGWPGPLAAGLGPIPWAWVEGWGTCGCGGSRDCGCEHLSRVPLGAWPIISIDEVWLDGTQLTDGVDYQLVEDRWLERAPGHHWPACSDVWAPLTDPDTFGVLFHWGTEPGDDAVIAARRYAIELALGMCNRECNLPSRVSSVIRQGVTVNFADPGQLAAGGKTGVPMVDTWVMAFNGGLARAKAPARIVSPDTPRRVRHIL